MQTEETGYAKPAPAYGKTKACLSPRDKSVLLAAATAIKRSIGDFVLESALSRANEALADRSNFGLSNAQWELFQRALNAPPRSLPRLKRLWDEPNFFDADRRRPG